MTERATREQLADLATLAPAAAVECIRLSIANGWTGLFPEKFRGPAGGRGGGPASRGAAQDAYAVGVLFNSIGGDAGEPDDDGSDLDTF